MISLPEWRARTVRQSGPQRPSWCYGTPGLARAQQLAALALRDPQRQRCAEEALAGCVADDRQLSQLGDASLCHGWAGLIQTSWRAAADAGSDSELTAHLPHLPAGRAPWKEPMNTTATTDTPPEALRASMVDHVMSAGHARSGPVEEAMRTIPRHRFVPAATVEDAYADIAVITKRASDGAALSCASVPTIVAMMLDQLDVCPGDRILEIGAGTGYNAAGTLSCGSRQARTSPQHVIRLRPLRGEGHWL